jgi:hypothetical protein
MVKDSINAGGIIFILITDSKLTNMETNNKDREQFEQNKKNNESKQQGPDEKVVQAHDAAEADMERDPDLGTTNDPTADLDEGEMARLDNNDDNDPI